MEENLTEKKIDELLELGRKADAIRLLDDYLKLRHDQTLMLRLGELLYAEGRMTEALNKFNALLRMDVDNQKAKNYVLMIRGILDYYNKDLLNP